MQRLAQKRIRLALCTAIALTSLAEFVYLLLWAMVLFSAIVGGLVYGWWIYGRGGGVSHAS